MADPVVIRADRVAQVIARHPWVDAGMVRRHTGPAQTGTAARLVDDRGAFLAWGLWTGDPRFPLRLVSWRSEDIVTPALFCDLARRAAQRRERIRAAGVDAYRLVFGEADGLPGLVVDAYAGHLVAELECPALRPYLGPVCEELCSSTDAHGVSLRTVDGLTTVCGAEPPELIEIHEPPHSFVVDPRGGQKTGWFCDQRENRQAVAEYADGVSVLDVFCYTGGFSVACLAAGAVSAHLVDGSRRALELARRNLELAGHAGRAERTEGDAFDVLKRLGSAGKSYGLVVLDPPKMLAPDGDRATAERAYRKLQAWAMRLVRPGGVLATFSCSGAIDRSRLDALVAEAAGDRPCRILRRLAQPQDHPVLLSFRKTEYLKGLILELD